MGKAKKISQATKPVAVIKKKDDTSKFNAILITVAVILGVAMLAACALGIISAVKQKTAKPNELTAVSSKNYKVTNAMMAYYFYSDYYSALSGQNGYMYQYYGLDTTKSLKSQECQISSSSENSDQQKQTWYDYFMNQTANSVDVYLAFAEDALAEGVSLDDDDKASIDETIQSVSDKAKEAGVTEEEYLEYMFGEGVGLDDIRAALELQSLGMKQYQAKYDAFEYSNDDLEAAYDEDPTAVDVCDYRSFLISVPEEEADTADSEAEEADTTVADETEADAATAEPAETETAEGELTEAQQAVKDAADAMAKATSEQEFVSMVTDYITEQNAEKEEPATEEEIDTQVQNTLTEAFSYTTDSEAGEWLFTEGRKEGDTTVISDDNGNCTVYFMVKPEYRSEYKTKNVRHILVSTSEYDTEDEAKAKADELYKKFEATSKTEKDFEALAEEYNDDSSSLYENVRKNEMVEEFNDWIFDEARKAGDCEIVKTTYGYHLIYFVGDGLEAWASQVENTLRSNDMNELVQETADKYPVEFEPTNIYKIAGLTAYNRTLDTTAAETEAAPETTVAESADDTAEADSDTETDVNAEVTDDTAADETVEAVTEETTAA